jgi:ribosomal protein S27E
MKISPMRWGTCPYCSIDLDTEATFPKMVFWHPSEQLQRIECESCGEVLMGPYVLKVEE